jgi:hypothetical protein
MRPHDGRGVKWGNGNGQLGIGTNIDQKPALNGAVRPRGCVRAGLA